MQTGVSHTDRSFPLLQLFVFEADADDFRSH